MAATQPIVYTFINQKTNFCEEVEVNARLLVYQVKQEILNRVRCVSSDIGRKESVNLGLLVIPDVKAEIPFFLSNRRRLSAYRLPSNTKIFVTTKYRVISGPPQTPAVGGSISSPSLSSISSLTSMNEGYKSPKKVIKLQGKSYRKKFLDAIIKGDVKKVKELLDKGLDPNFITEDGDTPLNIVAANSTTPEMIEVLTEGEAFVEFCGKKGELPLHSAVSKNNLGTLKALLDSGAWAGLLNERGVTAMYMCAALDGAACASILLDNNVPLDVTDENGNTELHIACQYNNPLVTGMLIRHGAAINSRNGDGNTPLGVAVLKNSVSCVDVILSNCKDLDFKVVNLQGKTAYQLALFASNNVIASKIQNKGGDVVGSIVSTRRASVMNQTTGDAVTKVCSKTSYENNKEPTTVLYKHIPNEPWELTIVPGEEVQIIDRGDDGWYDVVRLRDNERGFVPGQHLYENFTIKPWVSPGSRRKLSSQSCQSLMTSMTISSGSNVNIHSTTPPPALHGNTNKNDKNDKSKTKDSFTISKTSGTKDIPLFGGIKARKNSKQEKTLPKPIFSMNRTVYMDVKAIPITETEGPFKYMAAIPPPIIRRPRPPPKSRTCMKGNSEMTFANVASV